MRFPTKNLQATIAQAQTYIIRMDGGIPCPCCGQFVKEYRRKLNSTMARWLIELCRRTEAPDSRDQYLSVSDEWSLAINRGTGDVAKLAYWGLIEDKPKDPDDDTRRTSGLWKPTDLGRKFAWGMVRVPSHVLVYNGNARPDDSAELVGIQDCLGSKFNYRELMQS